jgi:hypothetical protein
MTSSSHNLAPPRPKRLKQFLVEVANLKLSVVDIRRFLARFGEFDLSNDNIARRITTRRASILFCPDDEVIERLVVPYVRIFARKIWLEQDFRTRDFAWVLFRADLLWDPNEDFLFFWHLLRVFDMEKRAYSDQTWAEESQIDPQLPGAPKELEFERALRYLMEHHKLTRHCPNPDCPAPYFLALRHTQRYCSEKCAQSGERDTKRKWWNEHGRAWRKERRAAIKSKKQVTQARKGTH